MDLVFNKQLASIVFFSYRSGHGYSNTNFMADLDNEIGETMAPLPGAL